MGKPRACWCWRDGLFAVAAWIAVVAPSGAATAAVRTIHYDAVTLSVIDEGSGPAVVMILRWGAALAISTTWRAGWSLPDTA